MPSRDTMVPARSIRQRSRSDALRVMATVVEPRDSEPSRSSKLYDRKYFISP
jgi:hypothetical protein